MAFMDSTAMVNRARSTVARADPATSIEHIMRTVMQRGGHEAPGAHASAALANAVVRKGSKYVIEPLDIKVRVVAELAVHCAIDAMAFIEALQFAHGASFEGAEKHLRGLGSAYMALEALVQVAPPGRFAERLFAQKDLTPQKITAILKEEPMLLFLLALAERERPTARNGGPVVWDAPRTINAIIYLCAAAIVDKSPRDGVLASLAWVHSISGSLFGDTSERSITPVLRILNTDPRILTDLVNPGLGEIEFMTRAACGQGDVDQARDIIEGATALWFALHESSVGVAVGGPTRLHDVLRSAGLHDAMQLADKVHWGDALGYARWAFGDPDRVQHAIGRFVYMINDPNMSAESPALWDEVIRRCEEAGFTCARSTVSALRDAAVIAADSALVAHAHAICNAASTRAIKPEALLGFIQHLKAHISARVASRYAPESSVQAVEAGMAAQCAGVMAEVYRCLPSYKQRTFRTRLAKWAKDSNLAANDCNLLCEACAALEAHCERERASNKRACEQPKRTRAKRQAREQTKER